MGLITALEGAGSTTIVSSLTDAFETIATDLSSVITGILPIAIGVVGAGMVIVFGVKWFKRLTNKA